MTRRRTAHFWLRFIDLCDEGELWCLAFICVAAASVLVLLKAGVLP